MYHIVTYLYHTFMLYEIAYITDSSLEIHMLYSHSYPSVAK